MQGQTKTSEQLQNEIIQLRKENESLLAKLNFQKGAFKSAPGGMLDAKNKPDSSFKTTPKISRLTKREKEILGLILKSHTSKEIASLLSISKLTVDTHRKHILKKLEVSSLIDLLKLVIQQDNI